MDWNSQEVLINIMNIINIIRMINNKWAQRHVRKGAFPDDRKRLINIINIINIINMINMINNK